MHFNPLRRLLTGCLVFVLLPACSLLTSVDTPPLDPAEFGALSYYNWVSSATTEELAAERQRLESQYPEIPNQAYVQLAVLLSASSLATPATENRALNLLGTAETTTDANKEEAALAEDYALLARLWRQTLQARADLRRAESESRDNLAQLQKLQQQLDVLMAIEKQMLEREQAPPE